MPPTPRVSLRCGSKKYSSHHCLEPVVVADRLVAIAHVRERAVEVHRVVAEKVVRREVGTTTEPHGVALRDAAKVGVRRRHHRRLRMEHERDAARAERSARCPACGRRARPGSSPSTFDQLTPAFSNTAPCSRTRATPPPPPGRCHASAPNVARAVGFGERVTDVGLQLVEELRRAIEEVRHARMLPS